MAKPVITATQRFPSRSAAMAHFMSIIRNNKPGDAIEGGDLADVMALLALHPEAPRKFGCGIAKLTTRFNVCGTNSFEFYRHDGSRDDFSIGKCINAN